MEGDNTMTAHYIHLVSSESSLTDLGAIIREEVLVDALITITALRCLECHFKGMFGRESTPLLNYRQLPTEHAEWH